MEITRAKASKGRPDSFLRRLLLNKVLLTLLLLMTVAVLFVAGTFYGGQLARTKQASTLMDIARGTVTENIKIIPNYINGLAADPAVLYIDMKNNDYQKLAYLRSEVLASGRTTISQDIKDEVVRGEISLSGDSKKIKARFSLTGQNFDHIGAPQKWSLRTDLKGGDLLFGMNKFTLLVPQTRARPPFTEWLNHKLEKHIGLISLNYEFVNVVLNGKNLGIYALEEHFDKRLLERNERREGLILKLQERKIKIFKRSSIDKDPKLAEQARHLETIWDGFWAGDIPVGRIFDIDKLAKYYAMTDLVNGRHTHYLGNEFFYLSPVTRLLEPIGREYSAPYMPKNDFRLFVEDLNPSPVKPVAAPNPFAFHGAVFKDPEFVSLYFRYLKEYASEQFLDAFVADNQEEIDAVRNVLFAEFPYYDISPAYLYDQVNYIKAYLESDFSAAVSASHSKSAPSGQLAVSNKHNFGLHCETLSINDERFAISEKIRPNGDTQLVLPPLTDSGHAPSSFIECRVPGIDKMFKVNILS